MENTDIRSWLPGSGWTDPDWISGSEQSELVPNPNWVEEGISKWERPPKQNTVTNQCYPLSANFPFDDPGEDNRLHYE